MSSKVWSIGIQKHTKKIQHHVHIKSTDQFIDHRNIFIYRASCPSQGTVNGSAVSK